MPAILASYCFPESADRSTSDDSVFEIIPKSINARIGNYRYESDRLLRSVGKLLLLKMLTTQFGQPKNALELVQYNEHGKPFLPGNAIEFSIAHTDGMVMCVVTDQGRIGLDAEKLTDTVPDVLADNFSELEVATIESSLISAAGFFRAWTRKEAVMKATGLGVMLPMHSFSQLEDTVCVQKEKYHLQSPEVSLEYACAIATNFPNAEFLFQEENFNDLFDFF